MTLAARRNGANACAEVLDVSQPDGFARSARLVYSLRWLHKAEPPDFELVLIQDESLGCVNTANLTLLGALRRRAPAAIAVPAAR